MWIRHVHVPGITANTEQLTRLRQFLDTLTNVERIDILPYHTLGIFKWKELGIPYTLDNVPTPTQEQMEEAQRILKS